MHERRLFDPRSLGCGLDVYEVGGEPAVREGSAAPAALADDAAGDRSAGEDRPGGGHTLEEVAEVPKTVTLSEPGVAGEWDVEPLEGGDLLLRRRLTTLDEILERQGGRRMTPEEYERQFGQLPRDGEG